MAADHDRDAGPPRRWYQSQIRVEIECMSDLYLAAAQVLAKTQTSTQRLPSKETPTQAKFRHRPELIRKRTGTPNETEMKLKLLRPEILSEDSKLPLGAARLERIRHQEQADGRLRRPIQRYSGGIAGCHQVILPPGQKPWLEREWAFDGASRRPEEG